MIFFSAEELGIDKVIYGTDTRKDFYQVSSTLQNLIRNSIVGLVARSDVTLQLPDSSGALHFLDVGVYPDSDRLGASKGMCAGQSFMMDPTLVRSAVLEDSRQFVELRHTMFRDFTHKHRLQQAYCSGTLVAPDRIVTAGHCVDSTSCDTTTFLFNYYVTARDAQGYPSFPTITGDESNRILRYPRIPIPSTHRSNSGMF